MLKPITKQQIEELRHQDKDVKLIDIRPAAEYEKMHIPGSLNIPADSVTEKIRQFDTNDTIVCVCTKGLERSQHATEKIAAMGYPNVYYLEEGVAGWLNK